MATLVVNPTTDEVFARLVLQLASEGGDAAGLQIRLRGAYPAAVVRPRGLSGEWESWYVYRDGHWIPSHPSERDQLDERA